jgi:Tat protein translocase TatB subunit
MLNVGPLELLVVLAVALVVVGPERLPELARSIGRALRQFREVQDEVRDLVSLGVDDDVREATADLRKATGDLRRATNVRGAIRRGAHRAMKDEGEPARRTGEAPTEQARTGEAAAQPIPTEPAPEPEPETPPEEAGGAPAARLVDDGAAPPAPVETEPPAEPTRDV